MNDDNTKPKKSRAKPKKSSTSTASPLSDLAALLNRKRSLRRKHAARMDPSRPTLRALRQRMKILEKATTAPDNTLLYYERPHVRAAIAAGRMTEFEAILGYAVPSFGRSSGPGFIVRAQDDPSRQVRRHRSRVGRSGKQLYREHRRLVKNRERVLAAANAA